VRVALAQLSLPLEGFEKPSPDRVVERTLEVLRGIRRQNTASLRELLPGEYGLSAVRLVRNMLPDGENLREIEIRDPAGDPEDAVTLIPEFRRPIREMLRALQPAGADGGGSQEADRPLEGVLRAVDLNRRQLRIDRASGESIPIRIPDAIGDDEIGMLLNRRVKATGILRRRPIVVEDLEQVEA
jgi:hypothetical protein